MNYEYVETLIKKIKQNNSKDKLELLNEFLPLINSLSKRTYINGYDSEDLRNECIITLLDCINKYNESSHRFVSYAVNSIKNTINELVRTTLMRSRHHDLYAFSKDDLSSIPSQEFSPENITINNMTTKLLQEAINSLNEEEQFFINYIYINGNTLTSYAALKNVSYVTVMNRKNRILFKLKNMINTEYNCSSC